MTNIMALMNKAKKIQQNVDEINNKLKETTFTSETGAGLVKIAMNGDYEIISLDVDDSLLLATEKTLMLDLIIAAYNDIRRKIKDTKSEQIAEVTAGVPLPQGMNLSGMFD